MPDSLHIFLSNLIHRIPFLYNLVDFHTQTFRNQVYSTEKQNLLRNLETFL